MTKVYVMESCPDCTQVKQLYKDNPEYELIDIGIPCFLQEDGSVIISLKHYDAALAAEKATAEYATGAACNLDGTGC